MKNRIILVTDSPWSELQVYDPDLNKTLSVGRGYLLGARFQQDDRLIAVELTTNSVTYDFYLTFDEAVDIFKHVLVLYKEHEEAGDFDE